MENDENKTIKEQVIKNRVDESKLKEKHEEKTEKVKKEELKNEEVVVTLTQKEFDAIKCQVAQLNNKYKELEHDYENLRKRLREDVESAKLSGTTKAIETLLPALDSFKKARKVINDKASISGITLIEKSILTNLEKLNVKKIDCVGKPFDPNYHNAVLMCESKDAKSGTVIEEIEGGYTINDKVIKYSQVVVAK